MDLAIYINELLELQGEVNLPGVGFFAQKRISGYYNEHEKKFYPPRHEISFDPQPRDDEGLAAYISKKKNISPASAKYFVDKYALALKQQASEKKVNITGLGQLYYEYATLSFKLDKLHEGQDPSFYGFAPVKAYKEGDKPAEIEAPPVAKILPVVETPPAIEVPPVDENKPEIVITAVDEPLAEETSAEASAEDADSDTQTIVSYETYEEESESRRNGIWVVVLLFVIITLLCFGIAYQYKPEWFGKSRRVDTTIIIKGPAPAAIAEKADSVAKPGVKKDSASKGTVAAKTINPPVDTFAVKHYDVSGGSFVSLTHFNGALKSYTSLGLRPRMAKQAGNQHLIILATFFNYADAKRTRDSILNIKGINKTRIFIQTYIPKK